MKMQTTAEVSKIVEKLKETPSELEENFGSKVWRWITLLTRICLWPIRALLMTIIVPASWFDMIKLELSNCNTTDRERVQKKLEELKQKYQTIEYSTSSNSKCSMLLTPMNNTTTVSDRKLVIVFGGNGATGVLAVKDFVKYKKLNSQINNDLLVVEYPEYVTTSQQLVDAGVSAVIRAIKAGYEPENITIAGHSLGGAVGALVLKEILTKYQAVMQGQKFAGYVNHRSFTNLGDVIAAKYGDSFRNSSRQFIQETKSSWLGWSINGFASLIGVQLDAESVLSTADSLPVKQMKFYADDMDDVIRHGASMAARMEAADTIRIKYTYHNGHDGRNSNSMYKASTGHQDCDSETQESIAELKAKVKVLLAKREQKYVDIKSQNNTTLLHK